MNLTWHIVKKDFRRLRGALLLWTLLLAAQALLCMRLFSPKAADGAWFEQQSALILVTVAVGWVFTFVLCAAFVLEDPLVGTQMFWVTRPIAGRRLLAAKALGILLALIVWPVIMAMPSWVYFGLSGGDLLVAAGRSIVLQLAIALVAVALASVAGQGSRFLLWTLALLAGVPLAIGAVSYNAVKVLSPDVQTSRLAVVVILLGVTALLVILHQYLSRRIVRSLCVLTTGLALAVLAGLGWSWNLAKSWPRDHTQQPGTEGIELTLASSELKEVSKDVSTLSLGFNVRNWPVELSEMPGGRVEATFRWPDGTELPVAGELHERGSETGDFRRLLQLPPVQNDPETEAKLGQLHEDGIKRGLLIEGARRGPAEREKTVSEATITASFALSPKWADRFKAEAPACTLNLRVLTGHPRVGVEVALREGEDRIGQGMRLRVLRYGDGFRTRKEQRGQKNLYVLVARRSTDWPIAFHQADHVRGTESWLYSGRGPGPLLTSGLLPVNFEWQFVTIPYPRVWRTDKWVDMPDWFADRSLVVLMFEPDGGFDRELHVEHLPLKVL